MSRNWTYTILLSAILLAILALLRIISLLTFLLFDSLLIPFYYLTSYSSKFLKKGANRTNEKTKPKLTIFGIPIKK